MRVRTAALSLTALASALACAIAPARAADWPKLAPGLQADSVARAGMAGAMIEMRHRADPLLLDPAAGVVERRTAWMKMLQSTADRTQADLIDYLKARGIEHRSYWINNTLWVRASPAALQSISLRDDIRFVHADTPWRQALPQAGKTAGDARAVEWGIDKIRAPQVWAAGVRGAGVTVAGQDTGVLWDHEALKASYRGWNGAVANHDYHWHDAVHSGGIAACPANSIAPCDDDDHGTHTVGTMVGNAGTNQIGVAPDAKWIACRNMDSGAGTPATYTECMQWFLAPTDSANANPDPSKAPDIINNSWGCPPGEGCTSIAILQPAVDALVDAGIFFVASAGNDGARGCSSITDPPAVYEKSFVVGSSTSADGMSGFSSRGPVAGVAGKPDVTAPGSNIRSATRDGGYGASSGTSMAGPHVAGAAALLISAKPSLRGHPDRLARILRATSVHIASSQTCGGIAPTTFPNPVQGHGRIDAYAAYQLAMDVIFEDGFE